MTHHEIRQRFLNFFEKRGHTVLPSASLVTTDEPGQTNKTLFNTAGMQPLVPYLMGEVHPDGQRLASAQKCLRTVDIEEVGDNTHNTFFEMLGNWSLGDYFKEDAINWSYEFLTNPEEGLGLDSSRIYVTVFAGNDDVPRDMESVEIWKSIGISEDRIYFRDSKDNWWTAGADSPAGPSSEMFYDLTGELGDMTSDEFEKADHDQKVLEIWNDVFMSYRQEAGKVVGDLPQKNVDTGAGLERITAVVQEKAHIYETTIFAPYISYIKENSLNYNEVKARIIADHFRATVFIISDGIFPSNTDRGYVLRRLIRRLIMAGRNISFSGEYDDLVEMIETDYSSVYRNIDKMKVSEIFENEKVKFEKAIERGQKELAKLSSKDEFILSGEDLSLLEQTHGLPVELTLSLAVESGASVSDSAVRDYEDLVKKHKKLSQTSAEGKFKGGLAGESEIEIKYHTTTHMLHQALREVLGNHVTQKGSNITPDRLRFDFSHSEKMTDEEKSRVEDLINEKIEEDLPVLKDEMTLDQAREAGALGVFGDKYGETVNVYEIGKGEDIFSKEICGGPHVESTGVLGKFRIKKEEASSAGVRRIKAVLE
ncbi:MAG: alanyl-tRNA synthetase [Candidatus Paceibacteria bacterium]|jgi:alanyl-tRNA synthetase